MVNNFPVVEKNERALKSSQTLIIARLAGFEPANDGNEKIYFYVLRCIKKWLKYLVFCFGILIIFDL